MIKHHPTCSPNYPEKPSGEPPQHVTRDVTLGGFWIDTCSDCGAFETNLPDESDPYWDDVRDELNAMEES